MRVGIVTIYRSFATRQAEILLGSQAFRIDNGIDSAQYQTPQLSVQHITAKRPRGDASWIDNCNDPMPKMG
jgi:hypothetical protein